MARNEGDEWCHPPIDISSLRHPTGNSPTLLIFFDLRAPLVRDLVHVDSSSGEYTVSPLGVECALLC